MLPAAHRMRRSQEFTQTVRHGRRAGGPVLSVHVWQRPANAEPVRVGLVVPKGVGTAVRRTAVKRRLRALARARLDRFAPGGLVVLRAGSASGSATSQSLALALDAALGRALSRPPRAGAAEPR